MSECCVRSDSMAWLDMSTRCFVFDIEAGRTGCMRGLRGLWHT